MIFHLTDKTSLLYIAYNLITKFLFEFNTFNSSSFINFLLINTWHVFSWYNKTSLYEKIYDKLPVNEFQLENIISNVIFYYIWLSIDWRTLLQKFILRFSELLLVQFFIILNHIPGICSKLIASIKKEIEEIDIYWSNFINEKKCRNNIQKKLFIAPFQYDKQENIEYENMDNLSNQDTAYKDDEIINRDSIANPGYFEKLKILIFSVF